TCSPKHCRALAARATCRASSSWQARSARTSMRCCRRPRPGRTSQWTGQTASPSAYSIRLRLSEVSVESMIASRPSRAEAPAPTQVVRPDPRERARTLLLRGVSLVVRLLLLLGAGAVMQIGWLGVWTLSYRLTHGNDFTFTFLMTQPDAWGRLMDMLTL